MRGGLGGALTMVIYVVVVVYVVVTVGRRRRRGHACTRSSTRTRQLLWRLFGWGTVGTQTIRGSRRSRRDRAGARDLLLLDSGVGSIGRAQTI